MPINLDQLLQHDVNQVFGVDDGVDVDPILAQIAPILAQIAGHAGIPKHLSVLA